jgi:hypothetical protein
LFWTWVRLFSGSAFLFIILTTGGILDAADHVLNLTDVIQLETFEEYPLRVFPSRWEARTDKSAASRMYQVEEEDGNRFLHATAGEEAIQIGLVYSFAPQKFSSLRWRWRVTRLPIDGDERRADSYDSAAGVYVLFDSRLAPRVVKYVWSATVPIGSRLQNPLYWRGKTIVLQSGAAALNEWREETVNFYDDYKNLFGGEPSEALGIALLTSADSTKSGAEADYDDFVLLPAKQ